MVGIRGGLMIGSVVLVDTLSITLLQTFQIFIIWFRIVGAL